MSTARLSVACRGLGSVTALLGGVAYPRQSDRLQWWSRLSLSFMQRDRPYGWSRLHQTLVYMTGSR